MKYFDSINNCPILIFDKINKTGDIRLLIVDKAINISDKELLKIWEKIFDEYIEIFGISETYVNWIMYMQEAIRLYDEAINEDKPHLYTMAQVKEIEASEMLTATVEDINITCAKISRELGFAVNPLKTTVSEFYSYIKIMQNGKKN
jgi:hypothetical protein